jgi:CheY-like chemotaxis protein
LQSVKILVVDDDTVTQEILYLLLKYLDARIKIAFSAFDEEAILKDYQPKFNID